MSPPPSQTPAAVKLNKNILVSGVAPAADTLAHLKWNSVAVVASAAAATSTISASAAAAGHQPVAQTTTTGDRLFDFKPSQRAVLAGIGISLPLYNLSSSHSMVDAVAGSGEFFPPIFFLK